MPHPPPTAAVWAGKGGNAGNALLAGVGISGGRNKWRARRGAGMMGTGTEGVGHETGIR
eukprot:CAMPEP_0114159730 /NCGR_PEP_ID=MMETSP0043_2-20121206/27946_1 /TAXON_ID=464988 /ORGANISM="Hemiselmis andersenii, Strain CCMP644" /LENGTH=58 /DNA_ID=CAMNT_0001255655 /DNA_START=199 /DNA_END=372 /DNA_ORIENTATION=-